MPLMGEPAGVSKQTAGSVALLRIADTRQFESDFQKLTRAILVTVHRLELRAGHFSGFSEGDQSGTFRSRTRLFSARSGPSSLYAMPCGLVSFPVVSSSRGIPLKHFHIFIAVLTITFEENRCVPLNIRKFVLK